jgi:hypothetical protein
MGCATERAPRRTIYDAAMLGRATTIIAASCLLLAACDDSGSDSDASTTTTSPTTTTTTTTTTTEAATTTTEAPPVETTEAPSTTIDTEAQLAAAEQAYLDAFDAYIAAARDPANPDLRADIERLYTGPSLEFTMSQLDSFVERNWVAREGDEPSRTELLLPPQFLPDRADIVELVACEVNTERFVEVGGAPDGTDALVNDEVTVRRELVRLEFVDGQWRSRSGETLTELATSEDCAP